MNLGFEVSLKELEELGNQTKVEETRREFDTDLLQNLELWDVLMKVSVGFEVKVDSMSLELMFDQSTESG